MKGVLDLPPEPLPEWGRRWLPERVVPAGPSCADRLRADLLLWQAQLDQAIARRDWPAAMLAMQSIDVLRMACGSVRPGA